MKKRDPKTKPKRDLQRRGFYLAGLQGIRSIKERKKAAKIYYQTGRIPLQMVKKSQRIFKR